MDESLFVRLQKAHSDAVVSLELQYRMCGPINSLANKLTYSGNLRCGNDLVENSVLNIPLINSIGAEYANQPWLLQAIQPNITQAVLFLDTSLLSFNIRRSLDEDINKSPINSCEAAVTVTLVATLMKGGVSAENIGIIAPYQSQVKFLKKLTLDETNLEINTVDQYQGRDKEIVIYNCTKSELEEKFPETSHTILHDVRRLTVAITRAKHKLVIIGDCNTMKLYPPFNKLLDSLEDHQMYKLCEGVDGFCWNLLRTCLTS